MEGMAEVREIDLIACEMTYIMRLISVTRERDEIKAHSTAFGYLFERRGEGALAHSLFIW